MRSLVEVTWEILKAMPLVLNPGVSPFFWPVTVIVYLQYRRIAGMERKMHGRVINPPLPRLLTAMLYGLGAGLAGSLMLVLLGVSLTQRDVMYLLPVALLLMLVHPRLLCFSYAGGLVSASHLLLGWPKVNVAAIMGLVAVLHLVEGLLVLWDGDGCRTPAFIETRTGQVVGGFSMQRFWPLPLIILIFLQLDMELVTTAIDMPAWWPLIAPPAEQLAGDNWVNLMFPVTAALGYADVALTSSPGPRTRATARSLVIYSVALFVVSIAAARLSPLLWVAAVMGPGAHELMVRAGSRAELDGRPLYVPPASGVMVLERLPGQPGAHMGLEPGDVILGINGETVTSGADLSLLLETAGDRLDVDISRDGVLTRLSHRWPAGPGRRLGIFLVPEPGAQPHMVMGTRSPLLNLIRRVTGRGGRGRGGAAS